MTTAKKPTVEIQDITEDNFYEYIFENGNGLLEDWYIRDCTNLTVEKVKFIRSHFIELAEKFEYGKGEDYEIR